MSIGLFQGVASTYLGPAAQQKKMLTRNICLAEILGYQHNWHVKLVYFGWESVLYCLAKIFAKQNFLLSSSMKLAPGAIETIEFFADVSQNLKIYGPRIYFVYIVMAEKVFMMSLTIYLKGLWFPMIFFTNLLLPQTFLERSSHQGKKEVASIVSKVLVSCLKGCGESV